jgi:hypothetical protein
MIRFSKNLLLAAALAAIATVMIWGEQPALAQGPLPGRRSIDAQAFDACTTTNYADIAAKSLGITAAVLRKDIVSGQTLQEIATSANVPLQTVTDALQAARKADIDQAVKDGVLTQDEAAAMESLASAATAPAPRGTRPARPQGATPTVQLPDISNIRNLLQQMAGAQPAPGFGQRGGGFGGFGGFGLNLFNLVRQYAVAAQALNLKCTDLVKTLITPPGKSIVAVAADQKVDSQTITDALTKAYKDALAQDVTDGVITQAQSDQLSASLSQAVAGFINNSFPMGPQPTPAQ